MNVNVSNDFHQWITARKGSNETIEQALERISGFSTRNAQCKSSIKITLIGPPNSGKTTLKAYFFEERPIELDGPRASPEPTRGIEFTCSTFMDLDAGIVDTSGQEIDQWLDGVDAEFIFKNTDVVLFVHDITMWSLERDAITGYLAKVARLFEATNDPSHDGRLVVLSHKIDKFKSPEMLDTYRKMIAGDVEQALGLELTRHVFFTSIFPGHQRELSRVLLEIMRPKSSVIATAFPRA